MKVGDRAYYPLKRAAGVITRIFEGRAYLATRFDLWSVRVSDLLPLELQESQENSPANSGAEKGQNDEVEAAKGAVATKPPRSS